MTVPALFSCSLVLERGEKRSGAGVALGPAPPSAALLRARPFLFWAPQAHPNDSGSDRRSGAGTDIPRSRAPHALLCRCLCGGAVLVRGIHALEDQARLRPRTGCSRRQGLRWKMLSRAERRRSLDSAAQWGTELAHRTQRVLQGKALNYLANSRQFACGIFCAGCGPLACRTVPSRHRSI